jgi:hypothetical protein
MVWPNEIGSAVLSQARSAKGGDEALAVDRGDRRQHVLVADAGLPELGDQALHGGDVHRARILP